MMRSLRSSRRRTTAVVALLAAILYFLLFQHLVRLHRYSQDEVQLQEKELPSLVISSFLHKNETNMMQQRHEARVREDDTTKPLRGQGTATDNSNEVPEKGQLLGGHEVTDQMFFDRSHSPQILQGDGQQLQTKYQQQDSQATIPKSKNKGQLWIHVGPPKTGTTTLQNELKALQADLDLDGYQYTSGMFRLPDFYVLEMKCQRALAKARLEYYNQTNNYGTANVTFFGTTGIGGSNLTRTTTTTRHDYNYSERNPSLYDILVNIPCWKSRLDQLEEWRFQGKRNVILSSEGIGFQWRKIHGYEHAMPADWISVKATLEPFYDIHIVIGYRRYFEWLVSSKYHEDQWSPARPRRKRWPPSLTTDAQAANFSSLSAADAMKMGREVIPVYPTLLGRKDQKTIPFHYSDTVLHRFQPYFDKNRIHILNIHENSERILTTFLCRIVTNAKHACRRSQDKDAQQEQEQRANVRKEGAIAEIFYDMIITKAALRGYFATGGLRRRNVVLRAKTYHQVRLKQTTKDLPMKCPTIREAHPLLIQSLQLEHEILNNASSASVLTSSTYNSNQTRAAFVDFLKKKMLCTVDVEECLREGSIWHDFFTSLKKQAP
ncbi:hypothetical protein ACA910_014034 [Epithemia clementina (nom. ined.)]